MSELIDQIFGRPGMFLVGDRHTHKTAFETPIMIGGEIGMLRWIAETILENTDRSKDHPTRHTIFHIEPDEARKQRLETEYRMREDEVLEQARVIQQRRAAQ